MAYDGKVLRTALGRFEEAKTRRAEDLRMRERHIYTQFPRVAEIDGELRATVGKIVASALRRGTDPRSAIAALREENLALQREKAEILQSHGYAPDFLDDAPQCERCGDSGWCGSAMCACLKEIYARVQNEELSKMLDLGSQSFETFDFSCYSPHADYGRSLSPRANMERVYDACRDYAQEFSRRSTNLLFSGDPGLGKTFLSASIARVVSEKGFSVVYDTAMNVFSRFEARQFNREADERGAPGDVERILNCDLLILDDLGTEMMTAFVKSAFYQIVNTRLMSGKKTVISTNLSIDELGTRYGAAVLSRIEGEYRILPFFGDDIRRMKR